MEGGCERRHRRIRHNAYRRVGCLNSNRAVVEIRRNRPSRRIHRRGGLIRHPFLLGLLECFVNSAHSFLSGSCFCSLSRNRSASVARERNASTKSNFSDPGIGGGVVTTAVAGVLLRSKSRATLSTVPGPTIFC